MKTKEYKFIEIMLGFQKPKIIKSDHNIVFDCGINGDNLHCTDCTLKIDCSEFFFLGVPALEDEEAKEFETEYPEYFI